MALVKQTNINSIAEGVFLTMIAELLSIVLIFEPITQNYKSAFREEDMLYKSCDVKNTGNLIPTDLLFGSV